MKRRRLVLLIVGMGLLVAVGSVALVSQRPDLAAPIAKSLRGVLGNEAVGRMETAVFTVQDTIHQWRYSAGLEEAEAPWAVDSGEGAVVSEQSVIVDKPTNTPPIQPTRQATVTPVTPTSDQLPVTSHQPPATATPTATPLITQTSDLMPPATATATPTPWTLPPVAPFGDLVGEGVWQPYLFDEAGEPVAVRTFLQPDGERPYALVAVVAFDLTRTALHYVLGSEEPSLPDGPRGNGRIPTNDLQANHLLATFNGGFMGTHGAYGAMADGLTAIPAKDGYATIAIYVDDQIALGEWGNDLLPTADYAAWRQNARLIVQNGVINERVYNGSAQTWGSSIEGDIVTWRSGLGLSADQQVLYFLAGPSMSMPVLAEAMTAVAVHNGMLLDINASWVHFTAIKNGDDSLIADPLFPDGMASQVDRYLRQSARDFFYVTLR